MSLRSTKSSILQACCTARGLRSQRGQAQVHCCGCALPSLLWHSSQTLQYKGPGMWRTSCGRCVQGERRADGTCSVFLQLACQRPRLCPA